MQNDDSFPYTDFATGWYQVAWSDEIRPGDVRPLRYFARDLVLWRTESGELRVFDAFCPHLGAHLGYGGTVCGENIQCPFHGWLWSSEGRNVEIPYSKRPNPGQKLKVWSVREASCMIMIWYDTSGEPPQWDPPHIPEAYLDDRYVPYPTCTRVWEKRRMKPQYLAENAVDAAHQKYVHRSTEVPEVLEFGPDGDRWHSRMRFVYGQGKDATWLTPGGQTVGHMDIEVWGMGTALGRFADTDGSVHVQTQTPVDHEFCDLRMTVLIPKEPGHPDTPSGSALSRLQHQLKQIDHDLRVWEHMHYIARPPFPPEEAKSYSAFREWAAHFYPQKTG
ncbi:Rieske 2Fe-2S domain-containing protein [Mycobacterium sp. CVI_P3]|uniref:cholesterol 7-desaturase n=1 Tax=Mycobacterium pinniadriaticum TaxID=2994102 RepID=A0ABT3SPP4_9MYCO|nr:Rieske 2Fe-2S domain-containing protein [Mycobacterium pinniadriaticum]MCX2934417.1 Rieske 2Fe-2S domain-containing protein [Mycobacterium pinniadriaticum]MCX2940840.1 Rieske 2Fe-2S domain-containing protein [Mycobacterium pinniadriaticum]